MSTRILARARTTALAVSLAGGSLLLLPAPAHAGVLDTPVSASVAQFSAAGTCTVSGPGSVSTPGAFAADGAPLTQSVSSSATYTKTGAPTDVTNLTAAGTQQLTVTQANNALKTIDAKLDATVTNAPALGALQTCNASAQVAFQNSATFDLPSPKLVTVTVESKNALGQLTFIDSDSTADGAYQVITYTLHSKTTTTFPLGAGKYVFQSQNGAVLQASTPTVPEPASRVAKLSLHVSFDEPGVAPAVQKGDAGKYVALAAGRNCAAGTVSGTWTNKAGKGKSYKVKKATFYVDDAKVKTVKKPKKKSVTTLTGLDPDQAADVTVKLNLVKKGSKPVEVERSYLACS